MKFNLPKTEWKPIKDISLNDRNPRKIEEDKFNLLKKNIEKHPKMMGVRPIVVDSTGTIHGGNMRYRAVQALEWEEVPVIYFDETWTEEEMKMFVVADNSGFGIWDYEILAADYDIEELADYGFEDLDKYYIDDEPNEQDDEVPETPEEPKSKLGDLYELGEHRVLCGDSTKTEDVAFLMNDKIANMIFTDPPYLMGFEGNVHGDGSKSHNAKFGAIENDKMSDEEGLIFIQGFLTNIKEFVDGAYYICWYRLGLHKLFEGIGLQDLDYKALIIWDKGNHTLSNSDYMSKYEPIVYGWSGEHKFFGDRSNFDLWSIKRTAKNELHPTMKPIELVTKAITNSSQHGGLVLDLFLGSGSTLIASEKTNRKCYGMELDPKYVDVIVQRYVDYTGNTTIKKNGEEVEWEVSNK